MRFNITIEQDEDGRFVAECIDLPGCLSEGDTVEEAIRNINEAIVGCLKSRRKVAGERIKMPSLGRRLYRSLDVLNHMQGRYWCF